MKNQLSIEGKVVLLTGAAGYLGSAIGKYFKDQGTTVIGLSKSKKVHDLGYDKSFDFDLSCTAMLRYTLDCIIETYHVNVLVNNAYDMTSTTGFGNCKSLSYTNWKNAFDCLYWLTAITEQIGESMCIEQHGSIINISSMYSIVAPDPKLYEDTDYWNPDTYSAMKAGINMFTKRTAVNLGKSKVRCNAVLPGAFPNESVTDLKFLQRLRDKTVLNRVGHPNDLVGVIHFLASNASSYITGQCIQIDGGWTIT